MDAISSAAAASPAPWPEEPDDASRDGGGRGDHPDDDDASDGSHPSSTTSESGGAEDDDEGWAAFVGDGSSVLASPVLRDSQPAISEQDGILSCRVAHLELPLASSSFLGIEREELVVTCQLLAGDSCDDSFSSSMGRLGDGSSTVASTRLPCSYRPSKGEVCWEQRLDVAEVRLDRLLLAAACPRLRLMLWAAASSTLLGQVELPLFAEAADAGGDGGGHRALVPQLGQHRVAVPLIHRADNKAVKSSGGASLGRRESCAEPPRHAAEPSSSRKRQLPPRWRRAASEPVGAALLSRLQEEHSERVDEAAPSSPSPPRPATSPSPFAWPAQGYLVIDVLFTPHETEAATPVGDDEGASSRSSSGGDDDDGESDRAEGANDPLRQVTALLDRPSDALALEEARLLWGHRHDLMQDGRALIKLLRAVLAIGPGAVAGGEGDELTVDDAEPEVLVGMWAERGCRLTTLDAMKLLGRHFTALVPVREFALAQLQEADDDELLLYLLQLVQLLRHEPWEAAAAAAAARRRNSAEASPSQGEDGASTEAGAQLDQQEQEASLPLMQMPPLARLLIERACRSLALANAFFWFLSTEMHDRQLGRTFESVRFAFLYSLRERNEPVYAAVSAQESWFKRILKVHQRVVDSPGLRERKQQLLRELLAEEGLARPPLPAVPLPIDPSLAAVGLEPASACVYGSKTYPAFLTFTLATAAPDTNGNVVHAPDAAAAPEPQEQQKQEAGAAAAAGFGMDESCLGAVTSTYSAHHGKGEQQEEQERADDPSSSSSSSPSPARKVVILKLREDLRQDQLVLQLVGLMDRLLRQHAPALDLRLTPYRVLATGHLEGLLEYVPGAQTVADVLASTHYGSGSGGGGGGGSARGSGSGSGAVNRILAFFQHHHPSPEDPLGVDPDVMDTYVRSCAGYCVVTHLLGVGDRHLHNIMLCPDGRLFHLDFGFILGASPKPVPLGPFRLSPAMVGGMGGRDHPNFERFKRFCVEAFKCLRLHARLLIGLLGLMVDASLKDLGGNSSSNSSSSTTTSSTAGSSASSLTANPSGSLGGGGGGASSNGTGNGSSSGAAVDFDGNDEAARVLARMERRFRLDIPDADEEAIERHFTGLIHKALGALGPQVVEVLHNLAIKAK